MLNLHRVWNEFCCLEEDFVQCTSVSRYISGLRCLTNVFFLDSVDNSEWMRNGDYLPTRMESQADAVNLICNVKTQQNPESTVGVMTMGGRR